MYNMMKLFVLSMLCVSFVYADTFQCKVTEVIDGNTFRCLTKANGRVNVRLYQINAPELDQLYGQQAKQALFDMIYEQNVQIKITNTGRSKSGIVFTAPPDNCYAKFFFWGEKNLVCTFASKEINLEMIKQGYAWYDPFAQTNREYQQAEWEARETKRGLWLDKNSIAPWARKKGKK